MDLSSELVSMFAKTVNDTKNKPIESTHYGRIVEYNGSKYVRLDGSDLLTPINTTVDIKDDERVTVMIKNHTATVTGNLTSPSASSSDVKALGSKITEFEIVIADKVSVSELEAESARINLLIAENAIIRGELEASSADISEIKADNVTIKEKLTAHDADIENLNTKKLDTDVADIKYATVNDLNATNADIHNLSVTYGDFEALTTNKFAAVDASIEDLEAKKLSATEAEIKYANIDFSNIGKAAFEYFYANSGLIQNVVVGDGTITGNLVGVTISGDLIEGNTIVAEKLVIKGEDGLYYKLNTDGVTTEAEQTDYNSLNGSVIKAKSITAEKINVKDLVAFGATIGGFIISDSSIYSGVKSSVDNTTRGIYFDKTGQIAIGDSNNYIKYFKDTDGSYKLDISAKSISLSASNKNIEDTIVDIQDQVDTLKDAITMTITSSNGTVFKNNTGTTVLTAHVFKGGVEQTITDAGVCGSLGSVKWYKGSSTTAVATAKTLSISASDVANSEVYTAQLE